MPLKKVLYIANVTEITAENMNDIQDAIEVLEKRSDDSSGGGFTEISETKIDGLNEDTAPGLNFYKVTPIYGSFSNPYYMICSLPERIGIEVEGESFQMRFKPTIEKRMYDSFTKTWGQWTAVSGGTASVGPEIKIDDSTEYQSLYLDDNTEVYYTNTVETLGITDGAHGDVFVGFHIWFTFTVRNADIQINNETLHAIKWIGDDCDASHEFTPVAGKSYEVDMKCIAMNGNTGEIIARVGAC